MSEIRFNTKADFVAALEARRPWARKIDRERTAAHAADEKAYLVQFRQKCRALVKMSYADLKAADHRNRTVNWHPPGCPMSVEAELDRELSSLALTRQERFTVRGGYSTAWYSAYDLLTRDENAHKDVCS